jgi:hypothetical protein
MIYHDLGWEEDADKEDELFQVDSLIELEKRNIQNFVVKGSQDEEILDRLEKDLEDLYALREKILSDNEDKREASIDPYLD